MMGNDESNMYAGSNDAARNSREVMVTVMVSVTGSQREYTILCYDTI